MEADTDYPNATQVSSVTKNYAESDGRADKGIWLNLAWRVGLLLKVFWRERLNEGVGDQQKNTDLQTGFQNLYSWADQDVTAEVDGGPHGPGQARSLWWLGLFWSSRNMWLLSSSETPCMRPYRLVVLSPGCAWIWALPLTSFFSGKEEILLLADSISSVARIKWANGRKGLRTVPGIR